jgi:glutamyl-tRNA reductase
MNTITVLSLSYKHAVLDVRAAFQFNDEERKQWYTDLYTIPGLKGGIVLSTCNRTEFYLETSTDFSPRDFIHTMQLRKGTTIPYHLFEVITEDSARYSMEVANGLHSMVMGDKQIIAQIKTAYRESLEAGKITTLLERLFQSVFRSYKRIHNETALHTGSKSISFIALKKIRKIVQRPAEDVKILLIGAGEIAADFMKYAAAKGYPVTITNRTTERAHALAARFGSNTVPFDRFRYSLSEFDVVVSCASMKSIITGADLQDDHTPVLIDLTTYKSIDLQQPEGYTFFSLDDLGKERDLHDTLQAQAVAPAREIIEEERAIYERWLSSRNKARHALQAI